MADLYEWVSCSNGEVAAEAVVGGNDGDVTLYVGRAPMFGDVLPGKIFPSLQCCFVCWGGEEHQASDYEALVGREGANFEWVAASGGKVPEGAVEGGVTQEGDTLFIGKASHEGTVTCGKIHPEHGCLYIPYGGLEISYENYEALVCKAE